MKVKTVLWLNLDLKEVWGLKFWHEEDKKWVNVGDDDGFLFFDTEEEAKENIKEVKQKLWWHSLSEEEKDRQIQNQLRFTC
jgi:hypothetical protein